MIITSSKCRPRNNTERFWLTVSPDQIRLSMAQVPIGSLNPAIENPRSAGGSIRLHGTATRTMRTAARKRDLNTFLTVSNFGMLLQIRSFKQDNANLFYLEVFIYRPFSHVAPAAINLKTVFATHPQFGL
jgi:hypothetical protein